MDTPLDQAVEMDCEQEPEMNFATFSTSGATTGTHFVTTGAQMPVAKLQQNNANGTLQQVVGMVGGMEMGGGVQYVRTLDGGGMGSLQTTPHLITLPITLPGAKPGDPQQTVQIQVLGPNLTMQPQQQPKYQMQIPIQGFQQGGAVLTVAYSPEATDGVQLIGPEGLQLIMPQEMQLVQPMHTQNDKDSVPSSVQQQLFMHNQIIVENKLLNNNTSNDNHNVEIIIKQECDDTNNDDESSQGTDFSDSLWQGVNNQDIVSYLNKLPQKQTQSLPVSLQQFLRLNPAEMKKPELDNDKSVDEHIECVVTNETTIVKKKKKYKKKPAKPVRQKPGQVIIATSSDGSSIFCCPECQMAFPEKENLELHLSVHKIERRFICGICGAGLKRKEHLERHKLGHNPERPYVCAVCRKGFKRREHLNLHTVIHSGVKTEVCLECGKGFYRKDHLRKHTRSHETKRAREESLGCGNTQTNTIDIGSLIKSGNNDKKTMLNDTILPEITIHVPTSGNVQVPVQINIPQHVMTSIAAHQAAAQAAAHSANTAGPSLDALLAQHT